MVKLGRDGVGVGSVVLVAERVAPEREGEPRGEKEPRGDAEGAFESEGLELTEADSRGDLLALGEADPNTLEAEGQGVRVAETERLREALGHGVPNGDKEERGEKEGCLTVAKGDFVGVEESVGALTEIEGVGGVVGVGVPVLCCDREETPELVAEAGKEEPLGVDLAAEVELGRATVGVPEGAAPCVRERLGDTLGEGVGDGEGEALGLAERESAAGPGGDSVGPALPARADAVGKREGSAEAVPEKPHMAVEVAVWPQVEAFAAAMHMGVPKVVARGALHHTKPVREEEARQEKQVEAEAAMEAQPPIAGVEKAPAEQRLGEATQVRGLRELAAVQNTNPVALKSARQAAHVEE